MNMHKNARLTVRGRERIVLRVESGVDAGDRCGSRRGLSGHGSQVGGFDIVGKVWRDCGIGHPGRISCGSRHPM